MAVVMTNDLKAPKVRVRWLVIAIGVALVGLVIYSNGPSMMPQTGRADQPMTGHDIAVKTDADASARRTEAEKKVDDEVQRQAELRIEAGQRQQRYAACVGAAVQTAKIDGVAAASDHDPHHDELIAIRKNCAASECPRSAGFEWDEFRATCQPL